MAGMSYTDETLHLISHYPIYAVQRGGVRFAYVAVGPGRVVAIGNVHLPATPYGPEMVRDGKSAAEVLKTERETRLPEIRPYLRPLSRQARARCADLPHRRLQLAVASRLDARGRGRAAAGEVPAALAGVRRARRRRVPRLLPRDPSRPGGAARAHLDGRNAAAPHPGPRDARPDRLGDGERPGHDARQQAGRGAGRPGRGHRHAVGLRPPLGGVDVRRHGGAGATARARRAARRARAATRSCSATSARAAPPSESGSCRPAAAGRSYRCRSRTPPTTARPTSARPACGRARTARACSATATCSPRRASGCWDGTSARGSARRGACTGPASPSGLRWSGHARQQVRLGRHLPGHAPAGPVRLLRLQLPRRASGRPPVDDDGGHRHGSRPAATSRGCSSTTATRCSRAPASA